MTFWKKLFERNSRDQTDPYLAQSHAAALQNVKPNWTWNDNWNRPNFDLVPLARQTQAITHLIQLSSKLVLSVSEDASICVWNVTTNEMTIYLEGHEKQITAAVLMKSTGDIIPRRLITASLDKSVIFWDLVEGVLRLRIPKQDMVVRSLCPLTDLDLFVTGGETLSLWNTKGELLDRVWGMFENEDIRHLLLITDNRIVCAYDKYLNVYMLKDAQSGEDESVSELQIQESISNFDLKEDNDGSLATSFDESTLCGASVLPTNHLKLQLIRKLPHHIEVVRVLQEAGDSAFISASLDGCVILWTCLSLSPTRLFNAHRDYLDTAQRFAFSVQSVTVVDQRLIIACVGNGFAVYDTATGLTLADVREAHEAKVTTVQHVRWLNLLVTGALDGRIRFWGFPEKTLASSSKKNSRSKTQLTDQLKRAAGRTAPPEKSFLRVPLSELVNAVQAKGDSRLHLQCYAELLGHGHHVTQIVNLESRGLVSCGQESSLFFWRNRQQYEEKLLDQLAKLFPT